jgi:hypothetical protein
MRKRLHTDIRDAITRYSAHLHTLLRKDPEAAFAGTRQKKAHQEALQQTMAVFTHVPLYELSIDVLAIRIVTGSQILFYRD